MALIRCKMRRTDFAQELGMKIGFIGLGVMGAPMAHRALGVSLPNTAMAQQLMNACSARAGGAEADHSSLVQALEILNDHELSKEKE
jgi:3-hydroxyisobutyrate dehydrogenase-like beta-hydroxyacid dehydrogenase